MRWTRSWIRTFALILLILLVTTFPAQSSDFSAENIRGPHIEDLYMVIIRDPDAQVLALEKGDIDVLGDITRPVDVERLSRNKDIDLSLAQGFHGFFLGFNLRKAPWDRQELRQGAWQSIPREQVVRDLFQGYAAPLSSFLPPASPYYEEGIRKYPFDLSLARKRLSDNGWTWDEDNVLIPPGADTSLEEMELLSPTAQVAPTTAELSSRIASSLRALGIPIEVEPMDFATMLSKIDERDFDTYVLAWSMTRDPDSLYAFYHSSMDIKGGYNLPGIHDEELDVILEELRWSPDEASARKAAQRSQIMLSEKVPVVPVYSRYSIGGISRKWKGVIKSDVTTVDNIWTLLNIRTSEGQEKDLYWCLADEPRSLNPFGTSSAYDWQVLGMIYDALIAIDPYTLEDIPWLATSWKVETLSAGQGDREETLLTFRLRDDVFWQDGEPLTAADVKSSIDFLKDQGVPRYYDNVSDVLEVRILGDHEVQVRLDKASYWYLHNIGGLPVFPEHIVRDVQDWRNWQPGKMAHPFREGLTRLIGTGPFIFREYRPGEFVRFSRNPLFWLLDN